MFARRMFRFVVAGVLLALALSLGSGVSAHAATPDVTTTVYKDFIQFNSSDGRTLREGRVFLSVTGGKLTGGVFRDVTGLDTKAALGADNSTLVFTFKVGVITINVAGCDFTTTECLATTTSGSFTATGALATLGYASGTWKSSGAEATSYPVKAFSATFTSGDGIVYGLKDLTLSTATTCNSHIRVDPFGTIISENLKEDDGSVSYLCFDAKNKKGVTVAVKHRVAGKFTLNGAIILTLVEDKGRTFVATGTGSTGSTTYGGTIVHPFPVNNPDLGTWTATIVS